MIEVVFDTNLIIDVEEKRAGFQDIVELLNLEKQNKVKIFIPVIIATYLITIKANSDLIDEFGDNYTKYMKRVPNLNVLWGMILLLLRKIKKERR